ncbi:MAG TPA: MFS transporter [Balneolales bacterium]|nr:MFS transporter [Balneolales bacterium]
MINNDNSLGSTVEEVDLSKKNKIGSFRWTICALLFLATTINYVDRQVIGILAPVLQKDIGFDQLQYGYIITAFEGAYALGLLLVGRIIDKIGTKKGYSYSLFLWSLAAMGHALVQTAFGFGVARFLLGLGESGNFPAAIKATAEWFPKKERALATGFFNSGANVGAIVAPLLVPWLTLKYGWPAAFIFTGAIGFVVLVIWIWMYKLPEYHDKVTKEELAYIKSDPVEKEQIKVPWLKLLKYRQTWAFVIGKFLTDPIWWFYLYWLPKFFNEHYGLDLAHIGLPLVVVYTMTTVGSIGGGWISSAFIKRNSTINKGRKLAMLICAVCVVPIIFASVVTHLWSAVALIGLAAAAHQGWSANIFTTASDMFPTEAVGSIVGLGGMAGAIGGMLIATAAGLILQLTGHYLFLFIICGFAYLIALLIFHFLVPKMEPVNLSEEIISAK